MKKILFVAFAALVLVGCKDKTAKDDTTAEETEVAAESNEESSDISAETYEAAKQEYLDFIKIADESVQQSTTLTEMKAIGEVLTEEGAKLDKKYGAEIIEAISEDEDIKEALEEYEESITAKAQELGESGAL